MFSLTESFLENKEIMRILHCIMSKLILLQNGSIEYKEQEAIHLSCSLGVNVNNSTPVAIN